MASKNTPAPKAAKAATQAEPLRPGVEDAEVVAEVVAEPVGEAAASEQPPAEKPCLRIAARIDGFRRAGRAWPASGVTVAIADFSAAQIDALKAEPELVVTEVNE